MSQSAECGATIVSLFPPCAAFGAAGVRVCWCNTRALVTSVGVRDREMCVVRFQVIYFYETNGT